MLATTRSALRCHAATVALCKRSATASPFFVRRFASLNPKETVSTKSNAHEATIVQDPPMPMDADGFQRIYDSPLSSALVKLKRVSLATCVLSLTAVPTLLFLIDSRMPMSARVGTSALGISDHQYFIIILLLKFFYFTLTTAYPVLRIVQLCTGFSS
jgi:hypothetical protein